MEETRIFDQHVFRSIIFAMLLSFSYAHRKRHRGYDHDPIYTISEIQELFFDKNGFDESVFLIREIWRNN